ncbi:MAG: ABC transporter substrate-binding protein [Alphaproteobacteria bacterium]|nr:ABC transporter substrate-binding protein [Alphaproteobacteria bacterium]
MELGLRSLVAGLALVAGFSVAGTALAQKSGGILRVYHRDSPASMSIHEEATNSVSIPMMAVFNNLVLFDQHEAQNRLDTIRPDLAASWSWSANGTRLTFKLREGVKWHDGRSFTAEDVKCTWDLLTGQAPDPLRANPRKSWWSNVTEVVIDGPAQATFVLKRPQPAILALFASGLSPVYPCHVPAAQMRRHPIGTGPFKFVEFRPNQSIKFVRNPDYWKAGRPYLDGIAYTIVPSRSTAILAFIAGQFDLTFPYEVTIPLLKDVKQQAPQATCELVPANSSTNLLVNREARPFDNAELRRALALALDRKGFIDTLAQGQGDVGAAMEPPPSGVWGMPEGELASLPGYDPDTAKNRALAREIMAGLGHGPDKRLAIKIAVRNIPTYRDPAVILVDQLKAIWVDAELDTVETANWFPKLARKDFQIGVNNTGSAVDDPDQQFFENYGCGSERNYAGYCNRGLEAMFLEQSAIADQDQRKRLVWEIDKKLQRDGARPILYHTRLGTCRQPHVKGLTVMVNSQYNGWRMEDVWLDK